MRSPTTHIDYQMYSTHWLVLGCNKILLTGSVFENDEGAGSRDLRAFSPYGLSKGFTWQLFRYHAQIRSMTLGKFVIPNPFGPL